MSTRIEYIQADDMLTIELPGAKVGDRVERTSPVGLLYWYDAHGKLRGISIPNAADLLGWQPEHNTPFPKVRKQIVDEEGRHIGWEYR